MRRPASSVAAIRHEHLQEGEDPRSEFVDDAVHWHNVYSALVAAAVATHLPDKAVEFGRGRDYWRHRWKALRDRQG
jgi:hypothetical protein